QAARAAAASPPQVVQHVGLAEGRPIREAPSAISCGRASLAAERHRHEDVTVTGPPHRPGRSPEEFTLSCPPSTKWRCEMSPTRRTLTLASLTAALLVPGSAHAQQLIGWAKMPAATFADGPTSGQFAAPNPYGTNLPPFVNRQPVQGFSAVLAG